MSQKPGGGYILVLRVQKAVSISIGKLGIIEMKFGRYYYGGSAKRGITARVCRHFAETKNPYWHIDYLTAHKDVDVTEAWCFPGFPAVEHALTHHKALTGEGILRGFGNSDCRSGCPQHLWKEKTHLAPEDFTENYYIEKNPLL